mmetsp:Transcript_30741/g.86703  ORF Transcript_30741/g.86703 Transcript_30741/m.86703 type:complete len:447 (-) Transcript_30741:1366-2706(-)
MVRQQAGAPVLRARARRQALELDARQAAAGRRGGGGEAAARQEGRPEARVVQAAAGPVAAEGRRRLLPGGTHRDGPRLPEGAPAGDMRAGLRAGGEGRDRRPTPRGGVDRGCHRQALRVGGAAAAGHRAPGDSERGAGAHRGARPEASTQREAREPARRPSRLLPDAEDPVASVTARQEPPVRDAGPRSRGAAQPLRGLAMHARHRDGHEGRERPRRELPGSGAEPPGGGAEGPRPARVAHRCHRDTRALHQQLRLHRQNPGGDDLLDSGGVPPQHAQTNQEPAREDPAALPRRPARVRGPARRAPGRAPRPQRRAARQRHAGDLRRKDPCRAGQRREDDGAREAAGADPSRRRRAWRQAEEAGELGGGGHLRGVPEREDEPARPRHGPYRPDPLQVPQRRWPRPLPRRPRRDDAGEARRGRAGARGATCAAACPEGGGERPRARI